MFVRELTLNNVRQFEAKTFTFQPGFNLLVGENGTGKTTVLRALLAALTPRLRAGNRHALTDDDVRLFSRTLQIRATVAENDGSVVGAPTYWRELGRRASRRGTEMADGPLVMWYGSNEATCGSFVSRRTKTTSRSSEGGKTASDEEWLREQTFQSNPEIGRGQNFGRSETVAGFVRRILSGFSPQFRDFRWSFEPYDCSIRGGERETGKQGPLDRTRRLLEDAILRNLQEQKNPLRRFDQPAVTIDSRGKVVGVDDIEPVISPFRELLRDSPDAGDTSAIEAWTAEVRLTPRILIRGEAGEFLLHQLSDGEQRLFSLFVDIARQLSVGAQLPFDVRETPALVLIDEIDVHLHPRWQFKIVEELQALFPACQFIATTHSPFVVQAVQDSRVQHITRKLPGDFTDRGIEEIAAKVMGIEDPSMSPRYFRMLDDAKVYFRSLELAERVNPGAIAELKLQYDKISRDYADNPAYQAFIELRREAKLGPDGAV